MELNILLGPLIPAIDIFYPIQRNRHLFTGFVDVDEDCGPIGFGSEKAGARVSRHRKEDQCNINGGIKAKFSSIDLRICAYALTLSR